MRTLTENDVSRVVWAIHKKLGETKHVKPENYCHPLKDVIVNHRLKRSLGRASSLGRVEISGYFVGLEASSENITQLVDTVLHELAHLYAGIKHGHNEAWKSAANYFGASTERLANPQGDLKKVTQPPWLLVATLSSGKRVKCKTAYKRTFKYLDHPHAYDIGGEPVKSFEWVKLEKRA